MAYNADIPQASDDPSQSQGQILGNFQELNTYLSVNHVSINDSDQGKHNFVQMPLQGSAPSTASSELAIYTATSTHTSGIEWFLRRQNNGSSIDLSGSRKASDGWFYTPSGFLIKWGFASGSGAVTVPYRVSGDTPVFAEVYYAQCQGQDTAGTPNTYVTLQTFNTTQLVGYCSSRTSTSAANTTFWYLVIGR